MLRLLICLLGLSLGSRATAHRGHSAGDVPDAFAGRSSPQGVLARSGFDAVVEDGEAEPVALARDPSPSSVRLALWRTRVGPVEIRSGELIRRETVGARRAHGLGLVGLGLRRTWREGAFGLTAHGGATLSLFHHSEGPALLLGRRWVFCGSESDVYGALSVDWRGLLHATLRLQGKGDPFHFVNGRDCLGKPDVWSTATTAGLEFRATLPHALSVSLGVHRESRRLYWDTAKNEQADDIDLPEYGVVATGQWTASIAVQVER